MECTLPRIRRRASLTLAALVAVWSLTALAVAGPLRLLASGAGVIDMSETGRFVLLHRDGRVPHYVRLDRATGETLGLRDIRGQTRMAPGGRVFFWNPDGQVDIYRQVARTVRAWPSMPPTRRAGISTTTAPAPTASWWSDKHSVKSHVQPSRPSWTPTPVG